MRQIYTLFFVLIVGLSCLLSNPIDDSTKFVNNNNAFAFDLYHKIKNSDNNIVYSPYSISTAFSMVYEGARKATEKEIGRVFHFSPDKEGLHKSFYQLQSRLKLFTANPTLTSANSFWYQNSNSFRNEYLNLINRYYDAEIYPVNFIKSSEDIRLQINRWVENKTDKKIKEILAPKSMDSQTRAVLCNAILFKGYWKYPFSENTKTADFFISMEKKVDAMMMNKENAKLHYKEFGTFTAIDLPYTKNDLSMVIFLPSELDGMAKLERQLNADTFQKWTKSLDESEEVPVNVSLPKFKTEQKYDLKDVFKKMGITHAFGGTANFKGICDDPIHISDVIHQCVVEVDEKGTEAAAATAVIFKKMYVKPKIFKVDRPFLFFIRDQNTNTILFIGKIIDPTK